MWKHNNLINLQLYAPANPTQITINWDSNITAVIGKNLVNGTTGDVTFTNGEAANTGANDGVDYTFEITLNSGYVLDTVTLSSSNTAQGVLKSQTDTSFVITAGSGGISQTITLTSKVAKIQTADVLKSIKTHIQQAYIALENKSATIPTYKTVENLKSTIESISTVDTADATATDADILSPKTAYAKDEKLTGSIATYNGEYEDISSGETYVLKSSGMTAPTLKIDETINFYNKAGTHYTRLTIEKEGKGVGISYFDGELGKIISTGEDGVSGDDGTITFETTPTGDLLAWLQANGTKQ